MYTTLHKCDAMTFVAEMDAGALRTCAHSSRTCHGIMSLLFHPRAVLVPQPDMQNATSSSPMAMLSAPKIY